ncbi:hypothetical protein SAMN05421783_1079 [Thiocapsa roseopersicina]|uniref:Uncharacterized protein n=1 Tax=Thiocapsa roseopersicina TaxID=1058 RepID=A0A1H2VGH5_THIRO|nr:hypothetical protein SAMN05421783_1079 [Thiocapsa roseopersicina]
MLNLLKSGPLRRHFNLFPHRGVEVLKNFLAKYRVLNFYLGSSSKLYLAEWENRTKPTLNNIRPKRH